MPRAPCCADCDGAHIQIKFKQQNSGCQTFQYNLCNDARKETDTGLCITSISQNKHSKPLKSSLGEKEIGKGVRNSTTASKITPLSFISSALFMKSYLETVIYHTKTCFKTMGYL